MRHILLSLLLLMPFTVAAREKKERIVTAEIAYAKPMQFDYDRDGRQNNIQMWAEIVIDRSAKGYTGYLRRYMKDIDTGKAAIGYDDINMLPDRPYGKKIPVSEVKKSGRIVSFKAGPGYYTLSDGGSGYKNDKASVNDGIREYGIELYDGDINISE
jgi:hypothetical protein